MAALAASAFLWPSLIILVYPPFLSLNLTAKSSTIFLTTLSVKNLLKNLLEARFPAFALVIFFSTKEDISLALASVVLIFSFNIKAEAKDFKRALL